MTRAERIAQQKDKTYARLVRRWRAKIYRALNAAIVPALEVMKVQPTEQAIEYAVQSMRYDVLEPVMKQAYGQAIETEADFTYGYLTTEKAYTPKRKVKEDIFSGGYGEFTAEQIIWAQQVNAWFESNGIGTIVSVNAYSKELAQSAIRSAINEAMQRNLNLDETAKLIERRVKSEWRKASVFRADRIARTELGKAQSYGAEIGAEATGLQLNKQWMTFIDGRERDSHRAANGQIVPMGGFFEVGIDKLKAPRIGGSAENVINCRCTHVHIPAKRIR